MRENMRKEINRINLDTWMGGRQKCLSGGSKGHVQEKDSKIKEGK